MLALSAVRNDLSREKTFQKEDLWFYDAARKALAVAVGNWKLYVVENV